MATIDIENPAELLDYLRQTQRIAMDETPKVFPLKGGVSNRTIWVERLSGEAWVLKQALNKLRVAVDWFSDPVRIHREADGLRWLQQFIPTDAVPDLIFEDHQQHILAMSAIPQPHANWKNMLLAGDIRQNHIQQFAWLLATIHKQAYENRANVAQIFSDRSFFESLRLEPYYGYTASQVPAATDFINALINDTRDQRLTLVHGDYSPKNILVHQDRLILLDYEVIHYGDPGFDLGFSMTHFLSKANHLKEKRQIFAEAASLYWVTYRDALSEIAWLDDLEARVIRHTLSCMLARVAGRSPLEYLTEVERKQQHDAIVYLMIRLPSSIDDLIQTFITSLDK